MKIILSHEEILFLAYVYNSAYLRVHAFSLRRLWTQDTDLRGSLHRRSAHWSALWVYKQQAVDGSLFVEDKP